MVGNVRVIDPCEQPHLEMRQLETLHEMLGPRAAEDVMCRAMEELAVRMGHIEKLFVKGARDEMRKHARALIAIAEQIGMASLARVAQDVVYCIDDCDRVALAATFSRLARVCDASLCAIWEVQDLQI